MKKLLFVLFLVLCMSNFSYASTNTFERDQNTLSVPIGIKVTSSNKNDILNTPLVDASEKIYDFADLYTDSEELDLFNKVANFINNYDMDMVIVTINGHTKRSGNSYADDFFDYNEFGKNKTRVGIVYLIDMKEREVVISTSGEAILYLDDERIDSILDSVYDKLHYDNYYEGANTFISETSNYIDYGVPQSNSNYYIDDDGNYVIKKERKVNYVISTLVAIVIATVTVLIFKSRHKGIKLAKDAEYYFDSAKSKELVKNDKFVSTHTSRTRIPESSSSGGHGGSSVHSGSSGRSHGGGSRHF